MSSEDQDRQEWGKPDPTREKRGGARAKTPPPHENEDPVRQVRAGKGHAQSARSSVPARSRQASGSVPKKAPADSSASAASAEALPPPVDRWDSQVAAPWKAVRDVLTRDLTPELEPFRAQNFGPRLETFAKSLHGYLRPLSSPLPTAQANRLGALRTTLQTQLLDDPRGSALLNGQERLCAMVQINLNLIDELLDGSHGSIRDVFEHVRGQVADQTPTLVTAPQRLELTGIVGRADRSGTAKGASAAAAYQVLAEGIILIEDDRTPEAEMDKITAALEAKGYTSLVEIGKGGGGPVFRADKQIEGGATKPRALKVITAEAARQAPHAVRWALNEAKVASRFGDNEQKLIPVDEVIKIRVGGTPSHPEFAYVVVMRYIPSKEGGPSDARVLSTAAKRMNAVLTEARERGATMVTPPDLIMARLHLAAQMGEGVRTLNGPVDQGGYATVSRDIKKGNFLVDEAISEALAEAVRDFDDQIAELTFELITPEKCEERINRSSSELLLKLRSISNSGRGQTVRLTDMGIARPVGADLKQDPDKGAGSVAYQPPESANDDFGNSPARDHFALGCTIVEVLTGVHPGLVFHEDRTPIQAMVQKAQLLSRMKTGSLPPDASLLDVLPGKYGQLAPLLEAEIGPEKMAQLRHALLLDHDLREQRFDMDGLISLFQEGFSMSPEQVARAQKELEKLRADTERAKKIREAAEKELEDAEAQVVGNFAQTQVRYLTAITALKELRRTEPDSTGEARQAEVILLSRGRTRFQNTREDYPLLLAAASAIEGRVKEVESLHGARDRFAELGQEYVKAWVEEGRKTEVHGKVEFRRLNLKPATLEEYTQANAFLTKEVSRLRGQLHGDWSKGRMRMMSSVAAVVGLLLVIGGLGVISNFKAKKLAEANQQKESVRLGAREKIKAAFASRIAELLAGSKTNAKRQVDSALNTELLTRLRTLDDFPEELLEDLLDQLGNGDEGASADLQDSLGQQASSDEDTSRREQEDTKKLLDSVNLRAQLLAALAKLPEDGGAGPRKPMKPGKTDAKGDVGPDPVDMRTLTEIATELKRAMTGRLDALDSALTRIQTEVGKLAWVTTEEAGKPAATFLQGPDGKEVTDAKTFDELWRVIEAMKACATAAADDDDTVAGVRAKERLAKLTPEMEQLAKTLGMRDLAFTLRRAVELIPGATDSRFFKEKLERFTKRARATHVRSGLGAELDIEALLKPLEAMLGENVRTATEMAATITDTMKERGIDLFDGRFVGTVLNVKGYPLEEGSEERMRELVREYCRHLDKAEEHGVLGLIAQIEIFMKSNQDFAAYNKDLLKSENLDDKGTGFGLQQRSKASLACNGAMNLLLRASTARHEGRVDPLYVELAQIPGMDLYLRNFLASAMNYHLQSYRVYSESGNATFLPDCRTAQNFMRYILNESLIGAYASETFAKINSGDICESLGIPNLVHTELDVARVLLNATLYFDDTVIPMIAKSLRILSSVDSGARYQRGSEILELIKKGGPSGHPLVAAVNNTSD